MNFFYVARPDGTVIGKFDEEALRARISRGDVSPSEQYSIEGREWKSIANFPGAQFRHRLRAELDRHRRRNGRR